MEKGCVKYTTIQSLIIIILLKSGNAHLTGHLSESTVKHYNTKIYQHLHNVY